MSIGECSTGCDIRHHGTDRIGYKTKLHGLANHLIDRTEHPACQPFADHHFPDTGIKLGFGVEISPQYVEGTDFPEHIVGKEHETAFARITGNRCQA